MPYRNVRRRESCTSASAHANFALKMSLLSFIFGSRPYLKTSRNQNCPLLACRVVNKIRRALEGSRRPKLISLLGYARRHIHGEHKAKCLIMAGRCILCTILFLSQRKPGFVRFAFLLQRKNTHAGDRAGVGMITSLSERDSRVGPWWPWHFSWRKIKLV